MKVNSKLGILIAKIAFFVYIVLSPFINSKYLVALNNMIFKVIFLIAIVAVSFIDLQLAIIMTLAFLVLIINLNKDAIFKPSMSMASMPNIMLPSEHFAVGLPSVKSEDNMVTFPDKCSNTEYEKEQISDDLLNLYIDPKIKPYETYIKQLSSDEQLEMAASGGIN